MASNRHLGRIITLQTLYEQAFREDCGDKLVVLDKILDRNITRYKAASDRKFIKDLTNGVTEHAADLDAKIQPIAPEWPLDQIARIDLIILRMGAYELIYSDGVPPKVVINEAVELAKTFGGDSSSRFVNGVLGTLLRSIDPEQKKKPAKEETKS